MSTLEDSVLAIAQAARQASYKLAALSSAEKNHALEAMACSLERNSGLILAENILDCRLAREKNMSPALLDRLMLNDERLRSMIDGLRAIAKLPDPIAKLITSKTLSNGLELKKIRVPIGVVAIIFEARPNVVTDVAALCLKSGNAAILRGGSECDLSNRALLHALNEGLSSVGFTPCALQMLPMKDYGAVSYLCKLDNYIDVIIPRGGEKLIKAVVDVATVPVIKHYKGICSLYIDEHADISMALAICLNAKCQRPSACNAAETILVHENIASEFIPKLAALFAHNNVSMRGCEKTRAFSSHIQAALPKDWDTEFLDLIIAIKIVSSLDSAIKHINTHGSHHSDAIISADVQAQHRFVIGVDSAAVYVNASTRFTDGEQFGLGAEMGISTDKLHARGPMGLNELTSYKWVARGNGQVRS